MPDRVLTGYLFMVSMFGVTVIALLGAAFTVERRASAILRRLVRASANSAALASGGRS